MKSFYTLEKINNYYLKRFIIPLVILFTGGLIKAQTFDVSQVEPVEFPILRTTFNAHDANNYSYYAITPQDFEITDNGDVIPPKYVTINCEDKLPASIVFLLDFSNSTVNANLDKWIENGIATFFDAYPLIENSGVAIVQFSGTAEILQDFTTDTAALKYYAGHSTKSGGSTNFNEAFRLAFNMLAQRPIEYPKYIIMMSDGKHKATGNDVYLDVDGITSGLLSNNITFFGITMQNNGGSDLTTLVSTSGGYGYHATDISRMSDIMNAIADILNKKGGCVLSWVYPKKLCESSSSKHSVSIKFLRNDIKVYRSYAVPDHFDEYVEVATDKKVYDFGTPPKNSPVFSDILITPLDTDFVISYFRIYPVDDGFTIVDWGDGTGQPPSGDYTLKKGDTLKLRVKFVGNGNTLLKTAVLSLIGLPCDKNIQLSAGVKNLTIINPVAGDHFTACQEVNIIWTGIDPDNPVDLYYSIDSGKTWYVIDENITGSEYNWKAPGIGDYMLRASVSVYPDITWIKDFGNEEDNLSYCITNDLASNVYICGSFAGTMTAGNKNITAKGALDAFTARLDQNTGNIIWAETLGTYEYNDNATALAADRSGNIITTGNTYRGFDYSINFYQYMLDGQSYLFLNKYNANNGSNGAHIVLGADTQNPDIDLYPEKIAIINPNLDDYQICIKGKYTGSYYSETQAGIFKLAPAIAPADFIAIFNSDLTLRALSSDIIPGIAYNSTESFDQHSNRYRTGNYYSDSTVYTHMLGNRGKSDFYVYKSAPLKSADIAYSGIFTVDDPKLTFRTSNYYLGNYPATTHNIVTMKKELINYGKSSVILNDLTLDGVMKNDFALVGNYQNIPIQAGDSIDIQIEFTPRGYGERNCPLTAHIDCADPISMLLKGIGSCDVDAVPLKYFGSVKIYDTKVDTIKCAIQNLTGQEITVTPRIEGPARGDYTMRIIGLADSIYNNVILPGNACFDIEVKFTPSQNGQRNAYITYYLPSNCNVNTTELTGNGSVPNLGITSYNWGKRRINGTYQGSISIYNGTPVPYRLTDIELVNQNQSIFGLDKPGLPVDIPANGSIDVSVEFNPTAEMDYNEQINAIIENREEPLVSDLAGSGFLPKLEIQTMCGEPVKIGDTSHAMVILTNPSTSSALSINKILVNDPDDEYFLEQNQILSDLVLDTNGTLAFGVAYTPRKIGDGTCDIEVYADNYDANFADQWKINSTDMNCPRLDIEYTNPLQFGPVLPCNETLMPVIIKNLSNSKTLTIYLSQAYFNQNNGFSLNSLQDIQIPPLAEQIVQIIFNPVVPGNSNNILNIPNSFNIPIAIDLVGESIEIVPSAENYSYTVSVGQQFNFPLKAALEETNPRYISSVSIYLSYDPKTVMVKPETFKEILTATLSDKENWTWEKPIFGSNNVFLEGNGKLNTPFDKTLYSIDFVALLTEFAKTDINAKIDYSCYESESKISEVNINPVCIQGSRYVQISDVLFGLNKISPSPANSVAEIEFGIGFDSRTNVEIYNSLGNLEYTLVSGNLKTGLYTIDLDCTKLSSGIYYIRFNSGGYSETKPLVVEK